MSSYRRLVSIIVCLFMILSSLPMAVYADDASDGIIEIPSSSEWQGSVFGNVGGQGKITPDNFQIKEHEDGSVTLRSSNNNGKIDSSSEGIAYYYQNIDHLDYFELRATAHIEEWTANNQVGFGIMLRERILHNESNSGHTSNYVAVGAIDQTMKGFYKENGPPIKSGYEFSADKPAKGLTYEISLKKTGNGYVISIGDEFHEIVTDGRMQYAGLFTSRNTTVKFSNVELYVVPTKLHHEGFQFRAFGENTSEGKNPAPIVHNGITLTAEGGKLAGDNEGISFYYLELPADANFEFAAQARVNSFNSDSTIGTPNQKSFGLMLRDEVGEGSSKQTSNYVAVGALDTVMKAFYKKGSQKKLDPYDVNKPAADEVYDLSIRKMGDVYVMSVNGQSQSIIESEIFTDTVYVGLFVARDASVTFDMGVLREDYRKPLSLTVDASDMNTQYLLGESLDTSGLKVTTVTQDDDGPRVEILSTREYLVTGFDSSEPGTNTISVHFNGMSQAIDLTIIPLTVIHMELVYYPAKTVYYPGDSFDPKGLTVYAEYNSGANGYLTPDLYTITIPGAAVVDDKFIFEHSGDYTVKIISTETPEQSVEFEVEVMDASLIALEIRQLPAKIQYFLGDELDLGGMIVYAKYSDGAEVRLLRSEYEVSGFDSSSTGDKTLTVSYKDKTTAFAVNVKEKEVKNLEISEYPKTTYEVGAPFDHTGLEVSLVYDNGDRDVYSDIELDISSYDASQTGVYEINIIPKDASLEPISFSVTVREAKEYEWKSIRFGQSTSAANNKVTVQEDGSILLEALGGSAGKVTGDHDGISYYYTVIDGKEDNFVLSADIQVIEYAKENHDGQESFGIMARDAIGEPNNSSIFASNIAAVGGYSGGTRNDNGTQLFVRTGVESPDGAGSQGIQKIMLKHERPGPGNTHPNQPYRLTLAKTNSGYVGKLNDGKEEIIYEPDILTVQDDKIYVGFYAARLATIIVHNLEFTVTAAATDAPRVEAPPQAVEPIIEILSPDRTSEEDYVFRVVANAAGAYTLKHGQKVIAQDLLARAGEVIGIPVELSTGNNSFSLAFIPDDSQLLTSYDPIISNYTVQLRNYQLGGDIYVSPTGSPSGDGSNEDPLDLDTAISFVLPGQKIIVLDGRYVRNSPLIIGKYNDGREDARKMLYAAEGAEPVIDFNKASEGVVHSGDYWHVKGLRFTRSADNTKGYTLGGNHNIIELNKFYANGDTGFQISRTDKANTIDEWPSHNLVLNNESYDNVDPSQNNADGFAAKLTSGVGNVFRGNVAHHNIDDGWDLYTKAGQGEIGPVILEYNIAYQNGTLTDGKVGSGDKNGFKLGGEGIHVPHIVRNNIAFENGAAGFTSNSNPGVILEDNISFNNGGANLNLSTYANIQEDFTLEGFISYRTEGTVRDNVPGRLLSNNNFVFDGEKSANASGYVLTDGNFASLTPDKLPFDRDAAGNLILGDFLKFIDTIPPGEVSDAKVISGDGKLRITWTNPVDEDLELIHISGYGETVVESVYLDARMGTTFTYTGLENGVTYQFRISTIDLSGNESAGVIVFGKPEASDMPDPDPDPDPEDTTPPGEVTNVEVTGGTRQLLITWMDPADEDLSKIYITGAGSTVIESVYIDKGVEEYQLTGLQDGRTYQLRIHTIDESGNMSDGVSISGTTRAALPPIAPPPVIPAPAAPKPEVSIGEDGAAKIMPVIEADGDSIRTVISDEVFSLALESAEADDSGTKKVIIQLDQDAKQVQIELPAGAVRSFDNHQVVISSSLGNITLPSNMLSNMDIDDDAAIELVVGEAEAEDDADRRVLEIHIKVNGETVNWSNLAATVTIEISYEPIGLESELHEFLAVVHIDDQGNRTPIYNGRYNPDTGHVEFTTHHFSRYAVVFAPKSFSDLGGYTWAQHEIEVLASKGIINGTSIELNTFSPAANISRADFVLLLVKTLGLNAAVTDNFSDVHVGDYYYEAVGIAKALGVTNGDGKGNFNPRSEITRQDMFTLTARALAASGYSLGEASTDVLDSFADKGEVADYALAPIAAMVAEDLVRGSNGNINPNGQAIRAEAAAFLYRIYSLN